MRRLMPPPGFREGHMGDLACPHRDLSCCRDCVAAHAEIVDVVGAHYWVPDPHERRQLLAELERTRS